MKTVHSMVAVAGVLVATAAFAQVPPITYSTATYQPLVGGTDVPFSPNADEGTAILPLGFSFPWFGTNYTQVLVSPNGFITFDTTACSFSCFSNTMFPLSTTPNNIIAPFWDDLEVIAGSSVTYKSSAGEFEIEWNAVPQYSTHGYSVTFRLKLTASGTVFISYGPTTGTAGSGSMGFENAAGALGAQFVLPPNTATCSSACKVTNITPNTVVTIGQPMQADLTVSQVTINSVTVIAGNNLAFNVTPTFRNYGLMPANGFLWKAYLSTDRVLDGADTLLYSSTVPLNAAATSVVTDTASFSTTTAPPTGQYWVLVAADTSNVVVEASESNNVGTTDNYFVQGLDLVAQSVTGPTASGPGNSMTVNLGYFNQGTSAAGTVAYKVFLSTDGLLSSTDFELYSGTRVMAGGQTVNEMVTFTVPTAVPGGDFYYLLQLDPANTITEANETNNTIASSSKVTMQQADLVNNGVDFLDTVTGASSRVGYFGQPARVRVNVSNIGGADARNFKVGVVVSTDLNLSLLSDTLVVEQNVAAVLQGATTNVDVDFTLPLNNKANQPFTTGPYYVFVLLDSSLTVTELNEGNNNLAVPGSVLLSAPAPDLTVLRLDAPSSAGVGEIAPVYRVLKNIGNVAAPAASYRYYASANAIITPDDIPLQIIGANNVPATSGTVTLGIGQSDTATDLVQLSANMPPGTYYIGCIVDSGGVVTELDENNNSLASSQVQVAASSLKVATSALPDAVVGRPYSFQLVAQGGQGPSMWTIDSTGGNLPDGLSLSADGLVTGSPTTESVMAFTAVVTNAGRQAVGRLVLRVLPTTTQVEITTSALPPVVNSATITYQVGLGASGGVKPYSWRQLAGTLPGGLTLSTSGTLSGAPRAGTVESSSKVTFEVRDSLGTVATREFTLRVVAAGSVVISANALSDGLVNVDYTTDISARNSDNSPLAKPIAWRIVGGALPDGLALSVVQDVAVISGTPRVAGVFGFTLQVEDGKGRIDSADLQIRVYPARLKVSGVSLPTVMRPGDTASFAFTAGANVSASFKLYSGALPPGLTVNTDGTVTGTIDDTDSEGSYNFVIEASDASNATGLGAFGFSVQRVVKQSGCSAAPSTGGLWLLLLALVPLLSRRRLGGLASLAVGALVLLPAAARAQDYQLVGPNPITYTALSSGVTVSGGATVTLPYTFKYYGTQTNQVAMSQYGYLAFSGSTTYGYNDGIPHNYSYDPVSFIAAWWDGIGVTGGGVLRYQTLGVAPRRTTVFEWSNVGYCSSPSSSCSPTGTRYSFQIILYENTNQIRMAYGPTAPTTGSASVGIQKALTVGLAALSCTTSTAGACSGANFPSNQAIDFFQPPDLAIGSLSLDQTGYAGVAFRAAALVQNIGGRTATSTVVRFYLSTNATLEPATDPQIGDTVGRDVAANDSLLVTSNSPIPTGTAPGSYFVIAVVDPDNANVEQNEANNQAAPVPITVGPPTADLVVASLSGPATSAPGAMVSLNRTLLNSGNAAAGTFKYTWFISDNSVVSISDRALSPVGTVAGLAAGMTDPKMESLALPSDLAAGQYWLGLCVNFDPGATPMFGLAEISQVNNCSTASQPMVVSTGALTVLTTSLPQATQYSPWGFRLQATGGSGAYVWAVKAGSSLPAGISLSPAGDLGGTPASAGTSSFEVQVSSGGMDVSASLMLMVSSGSLPLAVVDQELPAAEFARSYGADLVAVGGKPPYLWALKMDARLPIGLALATDGTLEGRASESGDFSFGIEVTDSAGTRAAKDLRIKVVDPTTMHIATSKLQPAYLKKDYTQRLQAVGGKAPYAWTLTKFQQLPENPTDQPGTPIVDPMSGNFDPDFGIHIEDATDDYLRGAPKKAGLYAVTFHVTDSAGAEDFTTLLLTVSYSEPLAITTTALPDAFINHEYAAKLSHNGGLEAMGIYFEVPCVKQATTVDNFVCAATDATQALPSGLLLLPDGTVQGTPNTASPAGVYSFLVKVSDGQGRQDVRSLSIRLRDDYGSAKTGCSSSAELPGLLSTVSLLLAVLRRRRNESLSDGLR